MLVNPRKNAPYVGLQFTNCQLLRKVYYSGYKWSEAKLGKAAEENILKTAVMPCLGDSVSWRVAPYTERLSFHSSRQDTYFRFDSWLGQCFSLCLSLSLYLSLSSVETYSGEGKKKKVYSLISFLEILI